MAPLRFALATAAVLLFGATAVANINDEAVAEMGKAQDHLDRGEYEQAIARFNVARSLAPKSSGPYLGLGLAHARAGRCEEALPFLEEYLRRKAQNPKPEAAATLAECRQKTTKAPGRITVRTDPAGAEVRVDDPEGPMVGSTPWESIALSPGGHRIFVTRAGYRPSSAEAVVAPGQVANLSITLVAIPTQPPHPTEPVAPRPTAKPSEPPTPLIPGKIVVEVGPTEAAVSINGVRVADATRHYEGPMVAGEYNVAIERDGYRGVSSTVNLHAGETASRKLQMRPLRKNTWLAVGIPMTVVAAVSGLGAIISFYLADGKPAASSDYNDNKTANAVMQGIFYPTLALAGVSYILYGVLNRGRVGNGPPLHVSVAPLPTGGAATISFSY